MRISGKHDRRRGFTIIEMVFVLSLVAVLTAIAVPMTISMRAQYRLAEASRDVISALQSVKVQAVKRGTRCIVEFTTGGYQASGGVGSLRAWAEGDQPANWAFGANDTLLMASTSMPGLISLYSANFTDTGDGLLNKAGFESTGLVSRSGGNFIFGTVEMRNNKNKYIRVTVNPAGQVSMQKSDDGAVWN